VNHHQQLLKHINNLPQAAELLRVCRAYKTANDNYAFELNGRLKSGLPTNNFLSDLPHLQRVICGTLGRSHTVYRMTSNHEFSASVLELLEGPFKYQAFMSTSDDASILGRFVPASGRPLLLEIECPPGIAFAPLDFFPGIKEGEYLLGCGTTFEVVGGPKMLSKDEVSYYLPVEAPNNLTVLKLRVTANPVYVKSTNLVTLIG
jgi:hypothetical protein